MNLTKRCCALGNGNIVSIEKQLLGAKCKVIDRAQQRAVVKDSGAGANHCLAGFERIVSKSEPWTKVVAIRTNAFVFPTQPITDHQVRPPAPFILRKDSRV